MALVGGDQAEVRWVDADRIAERVDVGVEEEVEGFDLLGPGSAGVVGGEGSGDFVGCEGRSWSGREA